MPHVDEQHILTSPPTIISRRKGYAQPEGPTNVNLLGSQGVQGAGTSANQVMGGNVGITYTGASTIGTLTYLQDHNGADVFQYQTKPVCHFLWCPVSTTNVRYWCGLVNSFVDSDTLGPGNGISGAAIRYSTVAGDTTWKFITSDGATDNVQDTGVALGANTPMDWFFDLYSSSSQIDLYMNGAKVASSTLHLPAAATDIGWMIRMYNEEALSKSFWFGRVEWSSQ